MVAASFGGESYERGRDAMARFRFSLYLSLSSFQPRDFGRNGASDLREVHLFRWIVAYFEAMVQWRRRFTVANRFGRERKVSVILDKLFSIN